MGSLQKEIIKYCLISLRKVNNILKNNITKLLQIRTKQDANNFIKSLRF